MLWLSRRFIKIILLLTVLGFLVVSYNLLAPSSFNESAETIIPTVNSIEKDKAFQANILSRLKKGQFTFRYDTFGDEEYWGGTLKLHKAIAGKA